MSYMWYNVNLIVWWVFFCTSQEICFCWIDFMALLIYIHVLYVLAIWQKINGKDWGLKKNCYSLNDPVVTRSTRCCDSNTCSSILSQEYIYNKWFHYYRVIRLSTLIIITNEVFFIPFSADWWCTLSTHQRESINVTKTSWWFTTELISHKPLFN